MAACIWAGSFIFLQGLFMPKYMSEIPEGALIAEYYKETTPHDVVFVGDCEVYENFSPVTLWEKYGITSFIRGSAQQLMWQSYYLMEETLKYEKPKVFVFNVLAMQYDTPQSEAYNRLNIDGMRLSAQKIKSAKASMTEGEDLLSYVFPILRYHSRWNDIKAEDFKYIIARDKVSHNGFLMRADVKAVDSIPYVVPLADYQFGENSYKYLDMMTKLCKDNGVELILIKAPSLYPAWYDEWDEQMAQYAKENDLTYINFLSGLTTAEDGKTQVINFPSLPAVGEDGAAVSSSDMPSSDTGGEEQKAQDNGSLDFSVDTYDMGLHLNLSGAEKLTEYFGKFLSENYEFKPHTDEDLLLIWEEKVNTYNQMKADQYRELEEYGYLKSFGAKPPKEAEKELSSGDLNKSENDLSSGDLKKENTEISD